MRWFRIRWGRAWRWCRDKESTAGVHPTQYRKNGGGGGIRTRGAREGSLVFKTRVLQLMATAHNRQQQRDGTSLGTSSVVVSGEGGEELQSSGPGVDHDR